MSLIWHIVRKDLRNHWPALVLWFVTGLVVGVTGTGNMVARHGSTAGGPNLRNEGLGLVGLMLFAVFGFLIVARVVLDDSLTDPGAWWRTKPIGRERMLAAKSAFIIGMFAIVPVATLACLQLSPGVRIPLAVVDYLGVFEFLVAFGTLSAAAAACSRDLVQCLPALPVVWFLFVVWFAGSMRKDFRYGTEPGTTWIVLIGLVASAAGVAALCNQFLTRRTLVTISLLLITGLGPFAMAIDWAWVWERFA
jgi:hypothetical protein